MGNLAEEATRLLKLAQAGEAEYAACAATDRLAVEAAPSVARAALEYTLAVAHLTRGDLPAAEIAATTCERTATEAGSPEWRANALAIRAYVRILRTRIDDAIADLVGAELALPDCLDPRLRGSAHTGVGNCYAELRMYELALPHMELAHELRTPVEPGGIPSFVTLTNLAETQLRWAEELERLGLDDPDRRTEHGGHVDGAAGWVAQIEAEDRWQESSWEPIVQRLRAEIHSYRDPAGSIPRLREVREGFPVDQWMEQFLLSTAALARALRASGRPGDALAVAMEGTAALTPGQEWALAMAVHHQVHLAELDLDRPGAAATAGYLHLTLQSIWTQRVRAVQGATGLLQHARLQLELSVSHRLAREDPLTGLANRRAYEEALLASSGAMLGLVLVDIDRFKGVNDTFGHAVGDGVLIRVATILRATARATDLVARFGGDELVVLVRGSRATVDGVGLRIAAALAHIPCEDLAPTLTASASIGWAFLERGDTPQSMLERADARMYRAKRTRYA